MQRVGGKDASKQFWKYHNAGILKKYQPKLMVGSLDSKAQAEPPKKPTSAPPAPPKKPEAAATTVAKVARSQAPAQSQSHEFPESLDPFGEQIPFSDPSWYQGVSLTF